LLAVAGGSIAVLDHAHVWVTRLAITAVVGAWIWIAWERRKRLRPLARTTIALMIAATLLTVAATSWPLLETAVFKTIGVTKKKATSQTG
jgi:hypothetical protein